LPPRGTRRRALFTGITYSEATLGGKRLELLLDAVPGTRRVAVIGSWSFSENVAIFNAIRQAAQARGVEVFSKGPDLPVGTLTVPGASQPEMS